jgi:peroxiredoxin
LPQVSFNTPAPDFTLANFKGQPVRLSDFRGKSHVVLVFNRGFT